jgi:hypothetical protein
MEEGNSDKPPSGNGNLDIEIFSGGKAFTSGFPSLKRPSSQEKSQSALYGGILS